MGPRAKPKAAPNLRETPTSLSDGAYAKELKDCFQRADVNGDGFISVTELGAVLQTLDGEIWTEKQVARFLKVIDTSQDGRIDYEEFAHWLSKSDDDILKLRRSAWIGKLIQQLFDAQTKLKKEGRDPFWELKYESPFAVSDGADIFGRQVVEGVLKAGGFDFAFDSKYSGGKSDATVLDCPIIKYRILPEWHYTIAFEIYKAEDDWDYYLIKLPAWDTEAAWSNKMIAQLTEAVARHKEEGGDWQDQYKSAL